MDPLGITASIISVIQLTETIISFLIDVKESSSERNKLLYEAQSIYGLLSTLRMRVEGANAQDPWFTSIRGLATDAGPLDQFKQSLESLASKAGLGSSYGLRKTLDKVGWSFEKGEVRETLMRIERLKVLINLALTNDLFTLTEKLKDHMTTLTSNVSNIKFDLAEIHLGQEYERLDRERSEILTWLSEIGALEFNSRQQTVFAKCQNGTGKWLLESDEFNSWMNGEHSTLWCPGIPGAGKTCLASIVINHLQRRLDKNKIPVIYLFCNYKEQIKQTAVNFMTSVLRQLVSARQTLSNTIKDFYKTKKDVRPTFKELANSLHTELKNFSGVFIIIDALDEVSENGDIRSIFLTELRLLPVRLFVTSRHDPTIEKTFSAAIRHEIRASEEDVRSYIHGRLLLEPLLKRHVAADPTLEDTMSTKIIKSARGMFLLAQFHMDSIARKTKRRDILRALENLPSELEANYDKTMERIAEQSPETKDLAFRVLLWVSHAREPLSVNALRHALAVEPGMKSLHEDDLDDVEALISACAGLVVVDKGDEMHRELRSQHRYRSYDFADMWNGADGIVRLVHYTLQEYLKKNQTILFPDVQTLIATACLTYLSFEAFSHDPEPRGSIRRRDLPWVPTFGTLYEDHPLVHYATRYWGAHTHAESEEAVTNVAVNFLSEKANVAHAWCILFEEDTYWKKKPIPLTEDRVTWFRTLEQPLYGMLLVLKLGLKVIFREILSSSILSSEVLFKTWLGSLCCYAAEFGQQEILELLMARQDVDWKAQNHAGEDVLMIAAEQGNESLVRRVLQKESSLIGAISRRGGKTALHYAVKENYTTIARLLLASGAEIESRDADGRTTIFYALLESHDAPPGVYARGLNIEAYIKDRSGRWDSMLDLMLEFKVDLGPIDYDGNTILVQSIRERNLAAVHFCLDNGLSIHTQAAGWQRKIYYELLNNRKDIVQAILQLLIEHGANLNSRYSRAESIFVGSREGTTLLIEAIWKGSSDLIVWLLEHGADPNQTDDGGRTALFHALDHRRNTEAMTSLLRLLSLHGASVNHKDNKGMTVVHAALYEYFPTPPEPIFLLVNELGVDIDIQDSNGNTPLHYVMQLRLEHIPLTKFFVSKGADVHIKNKKGLTPLDVAKRELCWSEDAYSYPGGKIEDLKKVVKILEEAEAKSNPS